MIKIAVIILGIITISMIACILCTSVIAGKRADESIVNNPASVSMLSGLRKPQIRF